MRRKIAIRVAVRPRPGDGVPPAARERLAAGPACARGLRSTGTLLRAAATLSSRVARYTGTRTLRSAEVDHVTGQAVGLVAEQPAVGFSRACPEMQVGNEANGLPRDVIDSADRSVRVPVYGDAESLKRRRRRSKCACTPQPARTSWPAASRSLAAGGPHRRARPDCTRIAIFLRIEAYRAARAGRSRLRTRSSCGSAGQGRGVAIVESLPGAPKPG